MITKMQATPNLLSVSPSFNSYSSSAGNLADIAARVVEELRRENNGPNDTAFYLHEDETDLFFHGELDQRRPLHDHRDCDRDDHDDDDDDDDDEFEFAFVCRDSPSSPISADEIFYNGQIRPVYYPLFGKNLQLLEEHERESARNDVVGAAGRLNDKNDKSAPPAPPPRRRQPLRKLMVEEERETATSCSSSEADELDGLQHGTFCVWTPRNGGGGAAGGGKKGKSTGSSKRWKFRDIIGRTNSDAKDRTIVVIAPSNKKVSKGEKVTGRGTATKMEAKTDVVSAATAEKVGKEEDKRRSYKQDLVGFLANVNGLSRNLHPF